MEVKSLFDDQIEGELRTWLSGFCGLADLYAGLPQLFSKLDAQHILGTIEDGASVVGPVHIGSRSIVQTGSVITGPAIIAEHVTIAGSVEIGERTYIGSNCSIAHGVSIRNSLILNGTQIGAGAYISDSLIGTGCIVGPHALLGIEPVRASENAPVRSPLVIVGTRSRVGAGAILEYSTEIAERATVTNGTTVFTH